MNANDPRFAQQLQAQLAALSAAFASAGLPTAFASSAASSTVAAPNRSTLDFDGSTPLSSSYASAEPPASVREALSVLSGLVHSKPTAESTRSTLSRHIAAPYAEVSFDAPSAVGHSRAPNHFQHLVSRDSRTNWSSSSYDSTIVYGSGGDDQQFAMHLISELRQTAEGREHTKRRRVVEEIDRRAHDDQLFYSMIARAEEEPATKAATSSSATTTSLDSASGILASDQSPSTRSSTAKVAAVSKRTRRSALFKRARAEADFLHDVMRSTSRAASSASNSSTVAEKAESISTVPTVESSLLEHAATQSVSISLPTPSAACPAALAFPYGSFATASSVSSALAGVKKSTPAAREKLTEKEFLRKKKKERFQHKLGIVAHPASVAARLPTISSTLQQKSSPAPPAVVKAASGAAAEPSVSSSSQFEFSSAAAATAMRKAVLLFKSSKASRTVQQGASVTASTSHSCSSTVSPISSSSFPSCSSSSSSSSSLVSVSLSGSAAKPQLSSASAFPLILDTPSMNTGTNPKADVSGRSAASELEEDDDIALFGRNDGVKDSGEARAQDGISDRDTAATTTPLSLSGAVDTARKLLRRNANANASRKRIKLLRHVNVPWVGGFGVRTLDPLVHVAQATGPKTTVSAGGSSQQNSALQKRSAPSTAASTTSDIATDRKSTLTHRSLVPVRGGLPPSLSSRLNPARYKQRVGMDLVAPEQPMPCTSSLSFGPVSSASVSLPSSFSSSVSACSSSSFPPSFSSSPSSSPPSASSDWSLPPSLSSAASTMFSGSEKETPLSTGKRIPAHCANPTVVYLAVSSAVKDPVPISSRQLVVDKLWAECSQWWSETDSSAEEPLPPLSRLVLLSELAIFRRFPSRTMYTNICSQHLLTLKQCKSRDALLQLAGLRSLTSTSP